MTRAALRAVLAAAGSVVALLVLLALLAVERAPRVTGVPVADAAAAVQARDLLEDLRSVAADGAGGDGWRATEGALNGALVAGGRLVPGLAARAEVGEGAVAVAASLPLPAGLWLNVAGALAESRGGLDLAHVRIGHLTLPPGLVVALLRAGGNRLLGDGLASLALDSVARVRTDPPEVTVAFDLSEADRERIGARLRTVLSGLAGTGDRDRIHVHLWHLQRAVDAGALPRDGSATPYLTHAVTQAHALAEASGAGAASEEIRAALYALALYCGDARFGAVVGVALPAHMEAGRNGCTRAELGGRTDLRQHFLLSAALEAATTASAAAGVGELKELLDSAPDGSGFSFDDMAANRAGVMFARTLLGLPHAAWPAFAARLEDGVALVPGVEGLPAVLSAEAFRAAFGDVDSPAYRDLIVEIDRRVAALPLYARATIY
jgi:uncharacterized protein YfiM (DUF2279 family)